MAFLLLSHIHPTKQFMARLSGRALCVSCTESALRFRPCDDDPSRKISTLATIRASISLMLMAIFDKSFIHGITADEAAVFDMHFMSNITPLFFVEVLADLEKSDVTSDEGRTALVRSLAGKTPVYHSYPNIPHAQIVLGELLGYPLELRNVPVVGGGRRVQTAEGLATVFDEPPEMKAKSRWHSGKFEDQEYALAKAWRDMLQTAPLSMERLFGGSASRFTFRDLDTVKQSVDELLDRDGVRFKTLKAALETLGIPSEYHPTIIARWKASGGPRFRGFAPYAAHVLTVNMFRVLAMASGLISPDKTSNYADMAYLYYLPFCEVFISADRLHKRCVPLFMKERQAFVWAHDLRPVLAQLVDQYLATPDIEEAGLIGVAQRTTFSADSFIGALQDRLHPRRRMSEPDLAPKMSLEAQKALVERLNAIRESPPVEPGVDLEQEDRSTSFTRMVPPRRGRFAFMPKTSRNDVGED